PVAAGLYAFIAGSFAFALLGTNRTMSIGADSTIAPVFAAGVAAIATPGTAEYSSMVTFVALMVGGLLAIARLVRLGWIADFLSMPVVTGLFAGIAITIVVRQLPSVLGVPGGGTTTIGRLKAVFDQRAEINAWAVAIAVLVLVILVVAERLDRRIPGALIGLVASSGVVAAFDLQSHGVEVVGSFQSGLPTFGVPTVHFDDVRRLWTTALTVAFLCI